jgi:transcriptional regulator with XRE-family HTH domain
MGNNIGDITPGTEAMLHRLGEKLRVRRMSQGFSAVNTSKAAGISRVTLNRVEKGESSVTAGAYFAVAKALGEEITLAEHRKDFETLQEIRLRDYPGFKQIAWHLSDDSTLSPDDVWNLFGRNLRFLDWNALSGEELHYLAVLKTNLEGLDRV